MAIAEPAKQLKDTLKKNAHSLTRARLAVFRALQDKEPLAMADVVRACGDKADRASVYRAVALFEELGIAKRLQIGWKYKLELSDAFHHHHHHLTCLKCGAVISLPEDKVLEERLRLLAGRARFRMKDHLLEIQGLCSDCR